MGWLSDTWNRIRGKPTRGERAAMRDQEANRRKQEELGRRIAAKNERRRKSRQRRGGMSGMGLARKRGQANKPLGT